MRLLLLTGFSLICLALHAQSMSDALKLFEQGQLDSAIAISKRYTQTEPGAYQVIGQSLVKQGKYTEAIPYLEKGKNTVNAPASVRAWCMHDLGIAYFMRGAYDRSKENLDACINMNATMNSIKSANGAELLFGSSDLYDTWAREESPHFVFHFQHIPGNADLYIAANEAAYDSINRFFRAVLPKKIDYFVWEDLMQAQRLFHQPLAFTKTAFCLTHTSLGHTRGHEITHSISMYAANIRQPDKLIFEGVASYFDFSGRDWMQELKKVIPRQYRNISIKDVWQNSEHASESLLYPLGAVLTGALIQQFGRDKFIQLLADQSYEHARKLYGDELDKLLAKLEQEIARR